MYAHSHSYASKNQLLQWAADLLDIEIHSLHDLMNGAVFVQLMDAHFPDTVPMQKVDFFGYTYDHCVPNFKILQLVFDKLDIRRPVDVQRILDNHQGTILELLQWHYKYLGSMGVTEGYDARERRSHSKHGGTDKIPRYGASAAAFKHWHKKESKPVYSGGEYHPGLKTITRDFDHPNHSLNYSQRMHSSPQRPRESIGGSHRRVDPQMGQPSTPSGRSRSHSQASHNGHNSHHHTHSYSHSHAHAVSNHSPPDFGKHHTSRSTKTDSPNGHAKGSAEAPRSNPAPIKSLEEAVQAANSATQSVEAHVSTLKGLSEELRSGELNFCIARGCVRSLQDVLSTLMRHTALLLKDTVLRLDYWNDEQRDYGCRRQVNDLLQKLAKLEASLQTVLSGLKTVEAGLPAPGTGVAGQPHEAVAKIAQSSVDLNKVLRQVDQAQADLPPLRINGDAATISDLARARLDEVDIKTQAELDGHIPEFLKTSTSHACKIGPFQFRKLRNSDVYRGRYARSKKCGDGCYAFMNGDVYEGEFKDDHMQGHGVYMFAGQGRYEGAWQAARYNGHGTETFAKGSTYAGEYVAGNRSGYGVCRYFNGDYYEGSWSEGVRNGSGMQQCMDGSNYVGQYKDAKREGFGVYTFHNGDCYLGTYKQDLPNGIGVYLFEKGQKYMGEWENGKKHGLCEYIVESGERYVGEWEGGKPKWVQSLGDTQETPELLPDMKAKVETALEVAEKARHAAATSQQLAADHWDVTCKAQTMVHHAVNAAESSAFKAQNARVRAMVLAHKLDMLVTEHVGPAGWPNMETN